MMYILWNIVSKYKEGLVTELFHLLTNSLDGRALHTLWRGLWFNSRLVDSDVKVLYEQESQSWY